MLAPLEGEPGVPARYFSIIDRYSIGGIAADRDLIALQHEGCAWRGAGSHDELVL